MIQPFKIFTLTFILFYSFISSFGQESKKTNFQRHLTVADINKICNSIDNNKNLVEGIREGETLDKKGGFDTYYLQNRINATLYRITDNMSIDRYFNTIFYYYHNRVIKAIATVSDMDMPKKKYYATYYFNNNKLIQKIGENLNSSNYKDILKRGLDFQTQFYYDMRRIKKANK